MSTNEASHGPTDREIPVAEASTSWPVEAIRAAMDGSRELPERVVVVLVVRVGQPLGRARGGWRKDVNFDVGEGFGVFIEKYLSKFTEVAASPETSRRPIELPANVDIYLRMAPNDSQEKYVQLSQENFVTPLLHRWKLLTAGGLARLGDVRFDAFLYVQRATPPEQFHRATAQRVENARLQRLAYETANAVTYGPITRHHLDVVRGRRPNATPFEVPTDNTTTHAIALGQQREGIRRAEDAAERERQTGIMSIKLNGLWMPVEVDIISLRRAIGLPDHDIFTEGMFYQFNPASATNPTMQAIDHLDDEDMDVV